MRSIGLLFITLLAMAACRQPAIEVSEYQRSIDSLRNAKNEEFKLAGQSPLEEKHRQQFEGLTYYPADTNYRVEASLVLLDQKDTFEMQTSTDRLPLYLRYGMISFKVNGRTAALEVYQNVEYMNQPGHENDLFIPFKDLTNGTETYGGGRYLDINASGPGMMILDFNTAYNPYCAYNSKYSCPLPPAVNSLNFEIRAGERSRE